VELKKITLNKKYINNTLKLILSIILVFYLVKYLSIDNIYLSLKNGNKILILCALFLMPLNIYLQFIRWKLLCLTVEKNDNKLILKSIFLGIAAGLITPLKAGEFFGRASVFGLEKLKTYTILSVYDRIISVIVTVAVGIVFSAITFSKLLNVLINNLLSIFVIITIFLGFLYFLIKYKKVKLINKIFDFLKILFGKFSFYTNLKLVTLAILFFFTYIFQFALLLSAFNGLNNFFTFIVAGVMIFFTNTVIPPVTLGELGVREGAAVYYSNYFNYLAASGFNSSLILFFFNIVIPSIIGLFIYIKERF
jgi:hypothetical protein